MKMLHRCGTTDDGVGGRKRGRKAQPNRGRIGPPLFINFPSIPTVDEGVQGHGKKGKEERKKEKSLPQASAASLASIFDEHDYGEATALMAEIEEKVREKGWWRFLGKGENYL